jgi:hypothetical protein
MSPEIKSLRSSPFWDFIQRGLVVRYRRSVQFLRAKQTLAAWPDMLSRNIGNHIQTYAA